MIPKKYRLKNCKAFNATYKNRNVLSNSIMTIYAGKKKIDTNVPVHFGFVVSKKYHKRAVRRNRIKRLLRECVRLAIKENKLGVLDNYMSFVIKPKCDESLLNLKLNDVQKSFYKLIERLK